MGTKDKRVAGFKDHVDATKQYEVDSSIGRLKRELGVKKRQYNELLEAFESHKSAAQFMSALDEEFTQPAPIVPHESSGGSESVAAAFASDWHVFERVFKEQVSGLNEYTPEIARESVMGFFRGVNRWVEIHRAGTKINTLLVGFLGDLITNMIHEDQMEANAGSPLEESLFATELIISGLDYLLENSGCTEIIVASCDGNHSRITKKKRHTNRVKHSLEWLIFQFIQQHYEHKKETRLKFNIAAGYHMYLPLDYAGGKVLRIHHGDYGITYQGGVGGLAVPAQRTIKQWNMGRMADLDVFGHWHTSSYPGQFVSVGSVMGYSPYSIKCKVEFEPPQQAFLLLEKKRWVTAYHKLYVR